MITLENGADRTSSYTLMVETAKTFFGGDDAFITILANLSALIKVYVDEINWAGFYLRRGDELCLGPFQGLPACSRIPWGRGVCGKAAAEGKPVMVADVHEFPGHIACDAASASELVIPFFKGPEVFGVLDVDSPAPNRFSGLEADCLGRICGFITDYLTSRASLADTTEILL